MKKTSRKGRGEAKDAKEYERKMKKEKGKKKDGRFSASYFFLSFFPLRPLRLCAFA